MVRLSVTTQANPSRSENLPARRRLRFILLTVIFGLSVPAAAADRISVLEKAAVPAFTGEEGAGAFTPGGRGGRVFEVIHLGDSGPGSLREAVEARRPRTVVFRVSGIIIPNKPLKINHPYITIAGQTAPGDGICIRGHTTEINTHDVVLRYLRFRRGNTTDRDDALGGYPVGNIIVDHCSASWGLDENLSLYRYMKKMPDGPDRKTPVENVTIQWCISSEALNPNNHAFGATWGGRHCSFRHNLFACNTGRNPSIGWGDHFDLRNNVLFNRRHRTVDGGDASSMVNVIANYYKPGPATNEGAIRYRVCCPQHLDMDGDGYTNLEEWLNDTNPTLGEAGQLANSQSANPVDWQAEWITANRTDKDPLPIFRKSVPLGKPVKQAIVHICGLGHYELILNGRRVGDHEMDPGWTNYRKTCLYSSYDVTDMLTPGENVLGVMLGNGMYNVPGGRYTKFKGSFGPPKLICQMHVTFVDSSSRIVASDETWKWALGPIVFTCIYGGEDYDARREQAGWDRPGFDDRAWSAATICDGPGGRLVAQYAPPVKVADHLRAVAIQRIEEGEYEIDCGVNLSARPMIRVKGSPGSKVLITCAEKRGQPWMGSGGHTYTYTLKGQGEEVFRPRFTYFSFQYLYISGVDRPEDVTDQAGASVRPLLLEAGSEFLTNSAALVGGFECSNPLFNEINAMIDRSIRSNLQSVLTDCPHREKLGWLEVAHLMGPSILYHRDVHGLYRKICRDTTDSQLDSGLVPDIAPEYTRFTGGFFESPEWGSACVQLPNLLYTWYGDQTIEQQQYETMARYTRYLASTRNDKGLVKPGLGDWYDWTPEKGHVGASQLTPAELPATAFLYDNARIMARVAGKLEREADAAEFEHLARQVRQDFITAYYVPAKQSVATGSQASLATALYFHLVPEEDRDQVLANLVQELERAQYRQSTGEVCFRMLVQALAEGGRSDVVYRIINRTDAPGYGHMLGLGFKTLSERWDKPGSSMNHCMFGHIQEWFHNSILGIGQSADSVGFRHLRLRPEPVGDLTSASGYYDSVCGRIESRWRIEDGRFHWRITVPSGTTAEVHVPCTDAAKVTERGRPADQVQGIMFLRMESARHKGGMGRAIFEIGPGEYEFRAPCASADR